MLALIGMPRSGTTWVAKAIDSHPKTYYLHEPDSVKRMQIPNIINESDASEYVSYVDDYLANIETVDNLKVVGRLPYFEKDYLNGVQLAFNRFSALASKSLGRFSDRISKGSPILCKPKKPHETFWKSIESMGRVSVLSQTSIPLKMLLLVRHPCAVINSELKGEAAHKFSSKTPVYEDWGLFEKLLLAESAVRRGLTLDDIKALPPAGRLAWKWLIYFEQLEAQAEKDNCMMVQYEYLCSEPLDGFKSCFEFLGLAFDEQVKKYLIESTSSHSDSYYATSKDPQKAMNSWKDSLDKSNITIIEEIVGDVLNNGYWSA